MKFVCEYCHREIKHPSLSNKNRFCSRECFSLWRIEQTNKIKVPLICKYKDNPEAKKCKGEWFVSPIEKERYLSRRNNGECVCKFCYIQFERNKFGFRKRKNEYRIIRGGYYQVPDPISPNRIKEFFLIIEKHFGRRPVSPEEVHHINENKLDDSINNLMLLKNGSVHNQIHKSVLGLGFVSLKDIVFDGRTIKEII